jgi:hypothetical protein
MGQQLRMAFLALDDIHQLYHVAPIALEASLQPDIYATLYCSTTRTLALVNSFLPHYPGQKLRVVLAGRWWRRLSARIRRAALPGKRRILRQLQEELLACDVVVAPDFYANCLADARRDQPPLLVLCKHGAGDGAYGFREDLKKYDLVLLSGEKLRRRMDNMGLFTSGVGAVVGYPKFDLVERLHTDRPSPFANNNPTYIYNPHFVRDISSWFPWGSHVVEFFIRNRDRNLIFAPHIRLARRCNVRDMLPNGISDADNILVDTHSYKLADMTYTLASDVYIGDVSSQVYEFIYRPRPCVFLNPHGAGADDPNYLHWSMGQVVDSVEQIDDALCSAVDRFATFRDVQQRLRDDTFSFSGGGASVRAVAAIRRVLGRSATPAPRPPPAAARPP